MGYLGTDMKREEKRRNRNARHRTQRLSGSLEEAYFASILTFDFKAAAVDLFVLFSVSSLRPYIESFILCAAAFACQCPFFWLDFDENRNALH